MSKKEYLIGVPALTGRGVLGGMNAYPDLAKDLPAGSMEFMYEWDRAVLDVIKRPEYKKHLGLIGNIVKTISDPNKVAKLASISVKYRGYHYARRFADAYDFANKKVDLIKQFGQTNPQIFDFGQGLSPWAHMVSRANPGCPIYTIDLPVVSAAYADVSDLVGIPVRQNIITWDQIEQIANKESDIFVSLGTFVYLDREPADDQAKRLGQVANNFDHYFIEVEEDRGIALADAKYVKKDGREYKKGWKRRELIEIMGQQTQRNDWRFIDMHQAGEKYAKISNALKKSTELCLVK